MKNPSTRATALLAVIPVVVILQATVVYDNVQRHGNGEKIICCIGPSSH
ncbi:hypothetical protein CLV24_1633 [Pontibacter ummariensis]|uniref:Uncharacterized protein n=1 Tax=Pontibacter ummariensis TaxID=1610492 RepID=A0A239M270_9BACT|nr:hypothetical protein [Pontibacter ummariensis]PRX99129.1 hypothetical protein CLV24_1633 [Pontibacter ummariensis]SNT36402.1 hypothetical protein SAMN06296052_1643 [Pontibacter ummariensis]